MDCHAAEACEVCASAKSLLVVDSSDTVPPSAQGCMVQILGRIADGVLDPTMTVIVGKSRKRKLSTDREESSA